MESCEMCGAKTLLYRCVIEGATLLVCENCSRFGKVVSVFKGDKAQIQRKPRINIEDEFEVVEDFSKIIKAQREKHNLKQEELALKISEKVSVVHGIESGHLTPSFSVARKLEKFFGIKLVERVQKENIKGLDLSNQTLTIGDLIKIRKSKNQDL